ncbi:coat protein [ssRNA phage Esthiorhiza.2_7]|jgi:hypothetical protein|uniref:Coat protein n=2 Tax=Norzivirales TaxID=2842247 RepID=A0A8S5L292_9VIRU|nr:coat protein [ssRNA phage Esthiorhiza.2_7]QDH87421.1 MAG: hypothetical protein H2RhizoLitter491115_000004 [Leviviridae sp.]DAD51728.1 TPA_asm: coat protein [ssRNA phage Esthiorhiza.2_7]
MSISLSSPVTGGAQTGLTSPTYTMTTDTPPSINGKQYVVTTLGGTQTNVRTHAVSDPFSILFTRPASTQSLPSANAVTGKYPSIPINSYGVLGRKGVNFAANQAPLVSTAKYTRNVPAGSDAYDAVNVRALESLMIGALWQQSAGWGDMLCNGVL